jgi:hypothetical protein
LLGREFIAVTLDPPGSALTDNFVKATLDFPYTPNKLVRLRPVALTAQGVLKLRRLDCNVTIRAIVSI